MAGVKPNPGPAGKKYIFRYEYLLIETGTKMLRMVFDHKVGPDFKVYLDNNPDRERDFKKLVSRKILTPVQLQLLPPNDNSPSSDNFDITLLSCLMRNTCGLCSSTDQVWSNPQSTDRRLEADITRLRICRNELAHSGSVLEDKTVLNTKWTDLCSILQRLGRFCGFSKINALIQEAEMKEIDENLQEKFENIKKEWRYELGEMRLEFKSDIEEVKSDIQEVKSTVRSEIRGVKRKRQHDEDNEYKDIQKELIDTYQNDICSSLPLCPLLDDETGGLLELYKVPSMYVVNYHKVEKQQTDKSPDELEKVKTCSDLFRVKDKDCKNIYLTGDAGVGKTSFCKFLSLLWCKSKFGKKLEKVDMQEYIDYLVKFEFVFYVNLRDTGSTDLKAIVVNQLLYRENKDSSNRMYDIVEDILGNHDSLVIMDGLDEWTPVPTDPTDKRRHEIPVRPKSLKCVYLTTCRPYKIENVRLTETNLDHQVKMTGLGKTEIESYVCNLINIRNTKYDENKNNEEFMKAVEEVNLVDMLHIPMTTSHLVMLWFDRPLTSMSKSLIYGNIMDMLFKLAQKKEIDIQQSKPSKLKLPDRLSELKHFKDHFSQIEQLCLLSFKLLFEHDTDITSLVFTRDQLASEPYCLSEEETNFFCTIGILSKNKVKRKFGKQEHKLSFLHKSYLEFFAAIYVLTLDASAVLELFSQCRTINDVLKYKNFLIFYAGLSIDNFVSLMTRIYSLISKDLDLTRVLSMFSRYRWDKSRSLSSLQDLILKCNIEGSYQIENSLPLEDFIFDKEDEYDEYDEYDEDDEDDEDNEDDEDDEYDEDDEDDEDNEYDEDDEDDEDITDTKNKYLRKLILSNINNVRLLRSDTGEYFGEFDHISNLTGLCIKKCGNKYKRKFYKLIKQNKSSLQIISIEGNFDTLPSLPLDDLHYLTSLSLEYIFMSHEDLQYLTKFLSNNSQLKHLTLSDVVCTEHWWDSNVCDLFELVQCTKLVYLDMDVTSIVCTNMNTSSLEYFKLDQNAFLDSIARPYSNLFNSIQYALELKYLNMSDCLLDDHMEDTLITNVQYLSKIEYIKLWFITIRDNVSFLLHPSVQQVSIELVRVSMTARCFQTFIESVINKHCYIKFSLRNCIIRQDTRRDMSEKESFDYIYDCIKSISAIKIVEYDSGRYPDIEFVINDNQ